MGKLALLVITLLLASCTTTFMPPARPNSIVWTQYAYELRNGATIPAEIGRLLVPVSRGNGDNRTLSLGFVRLAALPGVSGPPIIYLAGGPGSSGVEAGRGDRHRLFERLRRLGDVILLDQRGVGLSSPPPACSTPWHFPPEQVATADSIRPSFEAGLRACAAEWRRAGVPLQAFNTVDNAADVADLVRALGVPKARLVGISYGTFLAFAVLRDHGALIDRVVLAGTEGPDHTIKLPTAADAGLAALSDELREERGGEVEGGTLEDRVRRIFLTLEKGPVFVVNEGAPQAVSLFDAQLVVSFLMATSENALRLEEILAAAETGDFQPLGANARRLRGFYGAYPAMPYATDAASPSSAGRKRAAAQLAARSAFGNAVNFPDADIASALAIPPIPSRYRAPLETDVPALFISGTFDWRTPPAQAEEVRKGFRRSSHLILDGAGHDNDLFLSSPVILERIEQFLSGQPVPDETIDVDLLAGGP